MKNKKALDLFQLKDPNHKVFKFEHCYEILKEYPKWAKPENNQHGDESSPIDSATPVSLDAGDSANTSQAGVRAGSEGKGIGRKATKAKRKIANEKDPMWEEMMSNSSNTRKLLEQQILDNNAVNQARMNIEQQKLDLKREKYACRQRQLDMKNAEVEAEIMSKNLAEMTPFSKIYWSNKKQAIVDASARRTRATRNIDFSAGGSGESNVGEHFSPSYNNSDTGNIDPRGTENAYFPDLNDLTNETDAYGGGNGQWR